MDAIIKISNICKYFNGIKAVDDISLSINKGEMFGLIGPDGAGKTTTIRMLTGLIKPDRGKVEVTGNDIVQERKRVQKKIGYLSQQFSLYGDLTVDENIEFFAGIHKVKGYKVESEKLLKFTNLISFRNRVAEKLSGGMKQKLALVCSLIHKPEILFLDEPTTGVDPVTRRDFWKILNDLQKGGMTILMTTPYLDEAERCNRVALMNEGKIITADDPAIIKSRIDKRVYEITTNDIRGVYARIRELKEIDVQMYGDKLNILADNEGMIDKVKDILLKEEITINSIRKKELTLENVFIYMIGGLKGERGVSRE